MLSPLSKAVLGRVGCGGQNIHGGEEVRRLVVEQALRRQSPDRSYGNARGTVRQMTDTAIDVIAE
jgi:hypothetical protein